MSKTEALTLLGMLLFLAVVRDWGATLRTVVLMGIPIGAVVALGVYLGPYGIATLATLLAGEGIRRARARRWRRRSRASA